MTEICSKCSLNGHTEEADVCFINRMKFRRSHIITTHISLARSEAVILLSRELNTIGFEIVMYGETCRLAMEIHEKAIKNYVVFTLEHDLKDITEEITIQRKNLTDVRKKQEQYVNHVLKAFEELVSIQEELFELCREYSSEELEMADIINGFIDGRKITTLDYIKQISIEYEEQFAENKNTKCDCPLCYETIYEINAIARKECGHKHCIECFLKYLSSIKDTSFNPTCSICRQEVKKLVSGNPFVIDQFIEFKNELT